MTSTAGFEDFRPLIQWVIVIVLGIVAFLITAIFASLGVGWIIVLATAAAIIAMFIKPQLRLPRLGRGPVITMLIFICSFAAIATIAPSTEEQAQAILALPAKERGAEIEKASDFVLAELQKQAPELVAPELERRKAMEAQEKAKADEMAAEDASRTSDAVQKFWDDIIARSKGCEDSVKELAKAAEGGRSSRYDIYTYAQNASETCKNSKDAINALRIPADLPDEDSEALDRAIDQCSLASLYRMEYFNTAAKIADGDTSFKTVDFGKSIRNSADAASMQCVIEITPVLAKYGKKDDKKQ